MRSQIRHLKEHILRAACVAGEGHIASAFSILDILWVLYHGLLRHDPANPADPARDRFVLSKGHASLGIYGILATRGFFPMEELKTFASSSGRLGGHPDSRKVPGVEASTGSLGHGMPMAAGMALGLKIRESSSRVVCIVGDGECNEGAVWEAIMFAGQHRLKNLVAMVDCNGRSMLGYTQDILDLSPLSTKFEAFGWEACVVADGHDIGQLATAFHTLLHSESDKPKVLVANTLKGKGVPSLEGNPLAHVMGVSTAEIDSILAAGGAA